MINLYFGLPGSGKTSVATYFAIKEQIRIFKGKSRYERVVTNWKIDFPGIIYSNYTYIRSHACGRNTLIFIDEAQLDFSDRGYKNFNKADIEFFTMHRHYRYDINLITQQWDGVDRKIRVLINNIFYVKKKGRSKYSHVYPVGYNVIIPKRKDNLMSSPNVGQIIQGYERWGLIQSLFHKRVYRPYVYGYYDSFEDPKGALASWLPKNYFSNT